MSEYNKQHNRSVWMDIPVAILDRAVTFYSQVLNIQVFKEKFGDSEFAVLQHEHGNGGCLVVAPKAISAEAGILVYMNVDGRIVDAQNQTEKTAEKS